MFTGIIEEVGKVASITDQTITINTKVVQEGTKLGESISVNGACLTVVDIKDDSFSANISKETLKVTNLSNLKPNSPVNLERAMSLSSRLGGHIVYGHVDAVGKITRITKENEFYNISVEIPQGFEKYVVKKGSITIEGISLTVAQTEGRNVTIAIIPHTFNNTVLNSLKTNDNVNIEFDILAKYVEKILSLKNNSNITADFLERNGFL